MFQNLRQQRAVSPAQDTPRAIPSIKLTTATPAAPPSIATSALAPRKAEHTPRRVVPKRTLHEAPPPLPLPQVKVQPVKDHSAEARPPSRAASRFGSTNGKFKIFVDSPQDNDATPQFVQKKKSRAALDSIKWALGDRTNGPKDASHKSEKLREPRSSIDSDREKSDKEKWKWTLGRSRKEKLGRDCKLVFFKLIFINSLKQQCQLLYRSRSRLACGCKPRLFRLSHLHIH